MIVRQDYSNFKQFSFAELIIDTDEKLITIQYIGESSVPRIVSFVEIYSAVKQSWIKADKLMSFPFPMELVTESSIKLINGYGLRIF